MTIINPNSISGIVSVTATSNALHFYESDGDKLNINADVTGNVIGNLTGNVTGTTATFSGDVTVGGVLTYDDVTSIDSVGVVTARAGIRVTGDSIHVESSEDRLLYLKSTDANAYLTFEDTDSSSAFANRVGTVSDGLYFSTGGGGERVRIDSVGRLLIGRTTALASSAERLTINDGMAMFRRNNSNAAAVYIRNEDTTADTRQPYLIFTDGGGNRGGFGVQYNEASLWISGQGGIAFRTSGSAPSQEERLRITSGGDLALGTNNPAAGSTGGYDRVFNIQAGSAGALSSISFGDSNATGRIESVNGNNGRIAVNASEYITFGTGGTPVEKLRISSDGLIDASTNTNAVALPQGTTAQRPTGSAPYIRKNTTNNALEYYDGTSWVEIITDYFPTGSTILG